ncbi:MAG: hypothetical protein J1F12_00300 [Muribaculaceae bacterium]|nr:hypothetical protein [Muribaculaceae bacterium]
MILKNIKNNIYLFSLALLTYFAWSCTDNDFKTQGNSIGSEGYISITTEGLTRDTQDGEDIYNENAIKNYILVFYTEKDENCSEPQYIYKDKVNATSSVNVRVPIPIDAIDKVLPNNANKCQVFALVNLSDEDFNKVDVSLLTIDGNTASLANIKEFRVKCDFGSIDDAVESFVMKNKNDKTVDVTYNSATKTLTGTIEVTRLASKLRLWLGIAPKIYVTNTGKTYISIDDTGVEGENESEKEAAFINSGGRICTPVLPGSSSELELVKEPELKLKNGAGTARIDCKVATSAEDKSITSRELSKEDLFTSAKPKKFQTTGDDFKWSSAASSSVNYDYVNKHPLYSYPNQWINTPDEEQQSSMELAITWNEISRDKPEGNKVTYYYELPINKKGNPADCMLPNTYYRVGLSIGVLGNIDNGDPLEIEDATWEVIDWKTEDIKMSLKETRYLIFDQTEFVMNAVEDIEIPFVTSHDVELTEVLLYYYRFNETYMFEGNRSYVGQPSVLIVDNIYYQESLKRGEILYTIDNDYLKKGIIKFHHPLNEIEGRNSGGTFSSQKKNIVYFAETGDPALSKFDIYISLIHKDELLKENTKFKETVHIVQYPSIYIEPEYNDSYKAGGDIKERYAYTFINGEYKDDLVNTDTNDTWLILSGLSGYTPNMYVLTITQLGENEAYMIGDPRSLDYNNLLSSESFTNPNDCNPHTVFNLISRAEVDRSPVKASRKYNTDYTTLAFYYPTEESERTDNMIAPKLRVASGYGRGVAVPRDQAHYKCATYQEYGYPAGRWRLPTKAELGYFNTLSKKKKIPQLFDQTDNGYWTSQGQIKVTDNGLEEVNNLDQSFVRCVYDEWYWVDDKGDKDKCDPTIFTWGDKPKDNVQPSSY